MLKRHKREQKGQDPEPPPMPDPVADLVATQLPEGEHLWVAGAEREECQGLVNPAL